MHHAANVSVSAEDSRHESAGADYGNNGGKDLPWGYGRRISFARGMRLERSEVAVKMGGAELVTVVILVLRVHSLRVVFSSWMGHDCKMSDRYGVGVLEKITVKCRLRRLNIRRGRVMVFLP